MAGSQGRGPRYRAARGAAPARPAVYMALRAAATRGGAGRRGVSRGRGAGRGGERKSFGIRGLPRSGGNAARCPSACPAPPGDLVSAA